MSFGTGTKAELAHLWPEKPCCLQAELAGILAIGGRLGQQDNQYSVVVETGQAVVARLIYRLIKSCIGVKPRVKVSGRAYRLLVPMTAEFSPWVWVNRWPVAQGQQRRYSLRQLRRAGLSANCCRRAFLRGGFLLAGSVNDPRRTNHLEILLPGSAWGQNLAELLKPYGLKPHLGFRRGRFVLYFKDGEQIAQFLNVIGAHAAFLDFESARVYKDVKNRVNRLVNCDTANVNRTVEASARHMASIARLLEHVNLSQLPPSLREIAELRMNYPDASLRELGQMATPRIGKATVSHRLRRLEEMAKRLGGE